MSIAMQHRAFELWAVAVAVAAGCGDEAPGGAEGESSGAAESVGTDTSLSSSSGVSTSVTSASGSSGDPTDTVDTTSTTDDDSTTGSISEQCGDPMSPGLPAGAPALEPGVWTDISPPGIPFGMDTFTQGLAIDPCDPAIIYLTVSAFDVASAGLFKTTDAGATWTRGCCR